MQNLFRGDCSKCTVREKERVTQFIYVWETEVEWFFSSAADCSTGNVCQSFRFYFVIIDNLIRCIQYCCNSCPKGGNYFWCDHQLCTLYLSSISLQLLPHPPLPIAPQLSCTVCKLEEPDDLMKPIISSQVYDIHHGKLYDAVFPLLIVSYTLFWQWQSCYL